MKIYKSVCTSLRKQKQCIRNLPRPVWRTHSDKSPKVRNWRCRISHNWKTVVTLLTFIFFNFLGNETRRRISWVRLPFKQEVKLQSVVFLWLKNEWSRKCFSSHTLGAWVLCAGHVLIQNSVYFVPAFHVFLSYHCCLNGPVVLFSLYLALVSCLQFEGLLLCEKITIKQHSKYTNKFNPGLFHQQINQSINKSTAP